MKEITDQVFALYSIQRVNKTSIWIIHYLFVFVIDFFVFQFMIVEKIDNNHSLNL